MGLEVAKHRAEVLEVGSPGVERLLFQLVLATGQTGVGTGRMVVVFLADRANDGQFFGVPRDQRQVLADMQPGNVGSDRSEFPTGGDRTVGLHVPGVLVSWSPPHEQQDHPLGAAEGRVAVGIGDSLASQHSGQSQAGGRQRADLEHSTAGDPVAEPSLRAAVDVEHLECRRRGP